MFFSFVTPVRAHLSHVLPGSVWEWDEKTEEYYLHLYVPGQPDLNWENPKVRHAVYDMMKFWLDRGCDGFRVSDSVLTLAEL